MTKEKLISQLRELLGERVIIISTVDQRRFAILGTLTAYREVEISPADPLVFIWLNHGSRNSIDADNVQVEVWRAKFDSSNA